MALRYPSRDTALNGPFERRLGAAELRLAALEDDRKNSSYREAFALGGCLHWPDSPTSAEVESRLAEAAGAAKYRSHVRNGLRDGQKKPFRAPSACAPRMGSQRGKVAGPNPVSAAKSRPPARPPDLVAEYWAGCGRLEEDTPSAKLLRRRHLDVEVVRVRDLARTAKPVAPGWATALGERWNPSGLGLILPLFDALGRLCGFRARRVNRGGRVKEVAPVKGKGLATRDAVFACRFARRVLAGDTSAAEAVVERGMIVTEGGIDHLTWASRVCPETGPAVIGLYSGAWSDQIGERIPTGTPIYLRLDPDPAGHRYAAKVVASLGDRANLYEPLRPTQPALGQCSDENDRLVAGVLPAHPKDEAVPVFHEQHGSLEPYGPLLDQAQVRKWLAREAARASARVGATVLRAPTGSGKTYALAREVVARWRAGARIAWSVREVAFIDEIRSVLAAAGHEGLTPADRRRFFAELGNVRTGHHHAVCERSETYHRFREAYDGGGRRFCERCPVRDPEHGCSYLAARDYRESLATPRFEFTTHALEFAAGNSLPEVDLLVVDEDPMGAAVEQHRLRIDDLAVWYSSGDLAIDSETWSAVTMLFSAEDAVGSAELAAVFGGALLAEDHRRVSTARLHEAVRVPDQPPFRGLLALRERAGCGFLGCYVRGGELVVQRVRTLGRKARAVVVADATADPARSAAMFGPNVTVRAARFQRTKVDAVQVVGWQPNVQSGGRPGPRTEQRIASVLESLATDRTLVVTTKPHAERLRETSETARARNGDALPSSDGRVRVLYRHQAGSSGSNAFGDCDRVIVFPFWVPNAARAALSELVRERCEGIDFVPAGHGVSSSEIAAYALEVAPTLQALGRVIGRAPRADVFLLGDRCRAGIEPAKSHHVDALVAMHGGEVVGAHGAAVAIGHAVERYGAVPLNRFLRDGVIGVPGYSQGSDMAVDGNPDRTRRGPAQRLLDNLFRGPQGESASDRMLTLVRQVVADVASMEVRSDQGREAVLYRTRDSPEAVAELLRVALTVTHEPPRWFATSGGLRVELAGEFERALAALAAAGTKPTYRALEAEGISGRQVRRCVRENGGIQRVVGMWEQIRADSRMSHTNRPPREREPGRALRTRTRPGADSGPLGRRFGRRPVRRRSSRAEGQELAGFEPWKLPTRPTNRCRGPPGPDLTDSWSHDRNAQPASRRTLVGVITPLGRSRSRPDTLVTDVSACADEACRCRSPEGLVRGVGPRGWPRGLVRAVGAAMGVQAGHRFRGDSRRRLVPGESVAGSSTG